jgi:hypothetical protein
MDELTTQAKDEATTCPAVGYQSVSVCVPVIVKPFAKTGATTTTCCGEPVIVAGSNNSCKGTKNGSCTFTISQDICVKVPVEFGATTEVGDTYVNCKTTSDKDICTNCGDHEKDEKVKYENIEVSQ